MRLIWMKGCGRCTYGTETLCSQENFVDDPF